MTSASGSFQDLFNTDAQSDIFAGLVPNAVVVTDQETQLQSVPLQDGRVLVGRVGGLTGKTLTGTANQVTVTQAADAITFSLPQDIHPEASPTFVNVTATVDLVDVGDFKDDYDSKVDQDVRTTAEPRFNALLLADELSVGNLSSGGLAVLDMKKPGIDSKVYVYSVPNVGTSEFVMTAGDQTISGVKSFANVILPATTGAVDIGSTTARFRNLHLGLGGGNVSLGIGMRTSNRAELHLNANGDNVSEIFFGRGSILTENIKWDLSSRPDAEGGHLRLYRGPHLAGGTTFDTVFNVHGSTSQFIFEKADDSASKSTGAVIFKGGVGIAKTLHAGATHVDSLTIANVILPATTAAVDIGDTSARFRNLHLATGAGRISLGTSIRVGGQAELFLHANGDRPSEVVFGTNELETKNHKWMFSARHSPDSNHFRLYRGPALAGGSWEVVYNVHGSTSQIIHEIATDSTSKSTGSVIFKGGVGIAKTLHAGATHVDSLTIAGVPFDTTGFVTVTGAQTISGQKSFSAQPVLTFAAGGNRSLYTNSSGAMYASASTVQDSLTSIVYGSGAGPADLSKSNTSFGALAGVSMWRDLFPTPGYIVGTGNVAFGYRAGHAVGNNYNVAVGYSALDTQGTGDLANLNTAVGAFALARNGSSDSKGSGNTGVGYQSLQGLSTGATNTAIGSQSGRAVGSGYSNTLLGAGADVSSAGSVNRIAIGHQAICTEDNSAKIGSSEIKHVTLGSASATVGTAASPIGGVYLRTSGGTAALLNHYEEWKSNAQMNAAGSGSISVNPPVVVSAIRIGNNVTVTVVCPLQNNFVVSSGQPALICSVSLPQNFRPSGYRNSAVVVQNNNTHWFADFFITHLGQIHLNPGPNGYFVGSVNWFRSATISYNLN